MTGTLDTEAMYLRHNAAMRVLRADPTLTPEEALLYVVAPNERALAASYAEALRLRAAEGRPSCARCYGALDADLYCVFCGAVTSPDGELVGASA